jgi:putative tryptophan/tyrosine transport system substrate-binding protein
MTLAIGRREFLAGLGLTLTIPSGHARAQDASRMRILGVIVGLADDAMMQARIKAFDAALAAKGWRDGQNIRTVYRYADNSTGQMMAMAKEIVALNPDCIFAHSTPVCADLKQLTHTIPVVFVSVSDPIGSGFVASMARPGGNMTGFTISQPTITSKHLSILKQLVPDLTRVIALYNPSTAPGGGSVFLASFVTAAAEFKVQAINAQVANSDDIERVIRDAGAVPSSGMVVMPDNFTTFYRKLIISLAARYLVPTIYPFSYFVRDGGLISLGVDGVDLFRRASDYVDRVLRGANPADLPVQRPLKVELNINLKTAKALQLHVPRIILAGADAVIE